ncbi:hypothetical protein TVAG_431520 [Trichomonas vaginalis G3]|uniref:Uncharacterized protein n=1 Tax=Trichomonas vaginalis (strain ATCC PRA-98 / G3) TaxID=412133 RepID=A2FVA3_TRIV3|nr:hypothetical protein TVAGG3_0836420 [Trichomonas vaginalis G3]EAX91175.1 hypothetical protein TVAG_431520 [Trichomonas vaginalis G3]KAI5498956.1 hypothetical protein TVAGG3_0836420 [Trichomonas vaginalis G3]|eukprot:XP_001304105.1 hypothetical protein [Trichomonas vaginalis G3]
MSLWQRESSCWSWVWNFNSLSSATTDVRITFPTVFLAPINCVLTKLAFTGRPVNTRFTVEIVVLISGEYECE